MPKKNAMSLNPETFTEGGGLLDDVDVVVNSASFVMFDYNGKAKEPAPTLLLKLDHDGDEVEQYYSMGSNKDWLPSDDGKQLLAVGSASGIRKSSNGGIFLVALVDAGFPADQLGDDISVLEGMQAHMIRVPAPKRDGLKDQKEKKYDPTILVVSEIIAMPGEKKAPAGKPKGAPAAKSGTAKGAAAAKAKPADKQGEAGGDDINEKAVNAVMEVLAANDGTITKKALPAKLFGVLKTDPDRNAITKLCFDDEFLGSGPWTYEDDTLTA